MSDIGQHIFVNKIDGPQRPEMLQISLFGNFSIFPSTANRHWAFIIKGKARVMQGKKGDKELKAIRELIEIGFQHYLGEIPRFGKEKVICFIEYSHLNSRKDPDNMTKGLVDFCLEKTGVVDNDKNVLPVVLPLWWLGIAEEVSRITIIPWEKGKDDYFKLFPFVQSLRGVQRS